ncbi:MAG: HAD family hydrolase, partial [Pseudonocardiaceae bacterium]
MWDTILTAIVSGVSVVQSSVVTGVHHTRHARRDPRGRRPRPTRPHRWPALRGGLSAAAVLVDAGIDVLGLRELFQAVVTRDDVEYGKPAPDLFLEAARRFGIAPEDCLAVEDAPDGLTAARQGGCASCSSAMVTSPGRPPTTSRSTGKGTDVT